MTAPPSPGFPDVFCYDWDSDDCEASLVDNENSEVSSPEAKRLKRQVSIPRTSELQGTDNNLTTLKMLTSAKGSGSHISVKSVGEQRLSYSGLDRDKSSCHSLPILDRNGLTTSGTLGLKRRASLEEAVLRNGARVDHDSVELKSDRREKVVSSHYNHLKESAKNAESCLPGLKTADDTLAFSGFGELSSKGDLLLCQTQLTYETGDDPSDQISPTVLDTLVAPQGNCGYWSSTNSLPKDDDELDQLKTAAATRPTTQGGDSGDVETWNSQIENKFRDELEFSTLLTLAYVRVRDLTNNIDQASQYLSSMDQIEGEQEIIELRSEIQALFANRAKLALEHNQWRSEFTGHYQKRKKVLTNLKSQAARAERCYFSLRKELEDLQNEPVASKPKRSWFSRLCGFVK